MDKFRVRMLFAARNFSEYLKSLRCNFSAVFLADRQEAFDPPFNFIFVQSQ